MPVPRLTAVALYVESVRRSAAFYHSALSAADLVRRLRWAITPC